MQVALSGWENFIRSSQLNVPQREHVEGNCSVVCTVPASSKNVEPLFDVCSTYVRKKDDTKLEWGKRSAK
jgi:hypothetical protein